MKQIVRIAKKYSEDKMGKATKAAGSYPGRSNLSILVAI